MGKRRAMSQTVTHSQVPGRTHLRVHQSVVAERGIRKGAPDFQHYRGVEGRARSPEIRLGRRFSRSILNLHQNKPHCGLFIFRDTLGCWDKPRALWTTRHTPRSGLGGSHHLPPYSILYATPPTLHPNGFFSWDSQVGVPKLSRNCPGWSPRTLGAHNSRLQSLIATRSKPNL